jgi:hypothetical protein
MVDTTSPKSSSQPPKLETARAGAPEVEVTSEMIKAGAAAFYRHDPREDYIEEILPDVLRAMIAASKKEGSA